MTEADMIGLSFLLIITFTVLILCAAFLFHKGNRALGACILFAMLLGIIALGYLWFRSPM